MNKFYQLSDEYIDVIGDVSENLLNKRNEIGFERLTKCEKAIDVLLDVDAAMSNGGLNGLFDDCRGIDYAYFRDILAESGLNKLDDIFQKIDRVFPESRKVKDPKRFKEIGSVSLKIGEKSQHEIEIEWFSNVHILHYFILMNFINNNDIFGVTDYQKQIMLNEVLRINEFSGDFVGDA